MGKKKDDPERSSEAEREGFEPPVQLPVHRISSAARSTTPASLQYWIVSYGRCFSLTGCKYKAYFFIYIIFTHFFAKKIQKPPFYPRYNLFLGLNFGISCAEKYFQGVKQRIPWRDNHFSGANNRFFDENLYLCMEELSPRRTEKIRNQ